MTQNSYTLMWQEFDADNNFLADLKIEGYNGYLPFFVFPEQAEEIKSGNIIMDPKSLLFGIYFGLYELETDPNHKYFKHEQREDVIRALESIVDIFGAPGLADMSIEVSRYSRNIISAEASYMVLTIAYDLNPEDIRIQNDLLFDTWEIIPTMENKQQLLETVLHMATTINLEEVEPRAKELIVYYGLAAIVLLDRYDHIEPYLKDFVEPNLTDEELKQHVKTLTDDPESFTPEDLL